MILTCPNCYSQFKVGLAILGNQPRNVRCTACGEVWLEKEHLEPVDKPVDEVIEQSAASESFEDVLQSESGGLGDDEIPDVIRPDSGHYHTFAAEPSQKEKNVAYAVVVSVFLLVLTIVLMSGSSMIVKYPSSYAFYRAFGFDLQLPTEQSVTFANVRAEEHKDKFVVTGDIAHRKEGQQPLKMMQILITDGAEHVYHSWYATPPKAVLGDEETISFKTEYEIEQQEHGNEDAHGVKEASHEEHADQGHDAHGAEAEGHAQVTDAHGQPQSDVKYVEIKFVMKPSLSISKTDEEDVEDTPTPHGDESGHQNAHGAH